MPDLRVLKEGDDLTARVLARDKGICQGCLKAPAVGVLRDDTIVAPCWCAYAYHAVCMTCWKRYGGVVETEK